MKNTVLNLKSNCHGSNYLSYLSKNEIIELTGELEDYSHAHINNKNALFFDNQHFFFKSKEDKSLIKIHELFPSYFDFGEIHNVIHVDNTFWINTSNGLLKVSKKQKIFEALLDGKFIQTRNIIPIGNDSILVATEYGLYVVDYKLDKHDLLIDGYLYAIFYGESNQIYCLGEWQHSQVVKDLNNLTQIDYMKVYGPNPWIFTSGFWKSGHKPIVMSKNNLHEYDSKTNQLNQCLKFSSTLSHLQYINNTLFISTKDEIFEFDLANNRIKESPILEGVEAKNVSFIHMDTLESNFWLCTKGEGLIKWDYKEKKKKVFGLDEGLLNLNVHSIYPDSRNRFWMSTDFGISVMDRSTENIVTLTHENGLHQNEMNRHSSYFLEDSTLLFGSIDGIIKFKPNDITVSFNEEELKIKHFEYQDPNSKEAKIVVSDFSEEKIVIHKNYYKPAIQLDITDNTFYNKIRYRFRNSLDAHWKRTDNGYIGLSEVESDDLLFVSSQIGINKWSEPEAFEIEFKKPIYLNFYLYAILAVALYLILLLWTSISSLRSKRRADIIEQKVEEQTKELSKKNADLARANSINSMVFSIIGHDLKSPIISLQNLQENFKFLVQKNETENILKLATSIENNSQNVLNVINRLLDWSKATKDKDVIIKSVPIRHVVEQSTNDLDYELKKKKIVLEYQNIKEQKLNIEIESLIIVLRNLLHNAIKFSPVGGSIFIKFQDFDTHQEISIVDHGKGLSKNDLDNINKATSINSNLGSSGEKGLGLGLNICRELLKRFGGEISVKSTKPNGATFIIFLKKVSNH